MIHYPTIIIMNECTGCFVVTVSIGFIVIYTLQCLYGGLSISDCPVPAIISIVVGVIGLLLSVPYLILLIQRGIGYYMNQADNQSPIHWITYIRFIVDLMVQATMIGLLTHRDNGLCQYGVRLKTIAIILISFISVLLLGSICVAVSKDRTKLPKPSEPSEPSEPSDPSKLSAIV